MGYFITFEGGEGSGKSTQIKKLASFLKKKNIRILTTREPGGTFLGEKIRNLLLREDDKLISVESELLLLLAIRITHIQKLIIPALQDGTWVLCDRFIHSTKVYQCYAQGFPIKKYNVLNKYFISLNPDFTFFLDIPVKEGLRRAKNRNDTQQRFEKKSIAFHQKIRKGFLKEYKKIKNKGALINALQPQESVLNDIVSHLYKWELLKK